jgi:hypothetical protein
MAPASLSTSECWSRRRASGTSPWTARFWSSYQRAIALRAIAEIARWTAARSSGRAVPRTNACAPASRDRRTWTVLNRVRLLPGRLHGRWRHAQAASTRPRRSAKSARRSTTTFARGASPVPMSRLQFRATDSGRQRAQSTQSRPCAWRRANARTSRRRCRTRAVRCKCPAVFSRTYTSSRTCASTASPTECVPSRVSRAHCAAADPVIIKSLTTST